MVFWALFTICCVSLYIVEPYLITSRQEELLNSAVFSPVGGALCNMMTPKSMCQPQRCSRDHNFSNDKATSNKVVISYAHNGFGNQLWEHSFAWQVAESIGAQFYIMPIEQSLWRFGKLPQNTIAGLEAMKSIFPSSFFFPFEWIKYNKSMAAHMHAPQDGRALDAFNLCEKETFSYSDRLIDVRGTTPYALHRNNSLRNIIKDTKPRCLKFVGHFMNSHAPRCLDSFRKLWLPHIGNFYRTSKQLNGIKGTKLAVNDIPFSVSPQSAEPGLSMDSAAALVNLETQSVEVNDVCIYLRCKPAHYLWNTIEYYQTVLSRLIPDNSSDVQSPESAAGRAPTVWLFESPECFTKTKHVHHVLDFLRDKYKARRYAYTFLVLARYDIFYHFVELLYLWAGGYRQIAYYQSHKQY